VAGSPESAYEASDPEDASSCLSPETRTKQVKHLLHQLTHQTHTNTKLQLTKHAQNQQNHKKTKSTDVFPKHNKLDSKIIQKAKIPRESTKQKKDEKGIINETTKLV